MKLTHYSELNLYTSCAIAIRTYFCNLRSTNLWHTPLLCSHAVADNAPCLWRCAVPLHSDVASCSPSARHAILHLAVLFICHFRNFWHSLIFIVLLLPLSKIGTRCGLMLPTEQRGIDVCHSRRPYKTASTQLYKWAGLGCGLVWVQQNVVNKDPDPQREGTL